jgi:2-iminobutanoate/2-iminopropanoate deaminase
MLKNVQGPYSLAVVAGDYVFLSGQTGFFNPDTNRNIEGIENQTKQCLNNISSVLLDSGLTLNDVIKVTVFLKNQSDFVKMNEVYTGYFSECKPARSTVITNHINPNVLIEIECIAYRKPV